MSFQNLLFKHYNRSIQLLLMHCLVLHSQSAALSNVLAGWAIIGSTDTNRRGTDPVKPGTTRSVTGLHNPKEPGYSKENWFFNLNSPSGLSRYVIFLDVTYGCILSHYGEGFSVIWQKVFENIADNYWLETSEKLRAYILRKHGVTPRADANAVCTAGQEFSQRTGYAT